MPCSIKWSVVHFVRRVVTVLVRWNSNSVSANVAVSILKVLDFFDEGPESIFCFMEGGHSL